MKLRLSEPGRLIDIAHIPELAGISENNGLLEIGAMTVHHDIATSSVVQDRCSGLAETAAQIGDPQVRNRGTVGGSLAHADPAADYPAAMLALDAELHLQGPNGGRVVKASDFFQGVFTVDLAANEILVKVTCAPVRASAYAKLHQRASRFAIVGVAAALGIEGGVIQTARVGLTGATVAPRRLSAVESALTGQPATADTIATVTTVAGEGLSDDDLNADIHASAEYRRAMIPVFAQRALVAAVARDAG